MGAAVSAESLIDANDYDEEEMDEERRRKVSVAFTPPRVGPRVFFRIPSKAPRAPAVVQESCQMAMFLLVCNLHVPRTRSIPGPDSFSLTKNKFETDLRKGIAYRCTKEVGEFRVPADGKYRITCQGSSGRGIGKQDGTWNNHPGGGAAELRGHFQLHTGQVLRILVGGAAERDGCGGGASYVAVRTVEKLGWATMTLRPRDFVINIPDESVRKVGDDYTAVGEAQWGNRYVRALISVPRHLLPNTEYKVAIPRKAKWKRKFTPLLVAGGGGERVRTARGATHCFRQMEEGEAVRLVALVARMAALEPRCSPVFLLPTVVRE